MNYTSVMKELKTLGTAQNRKIYTRHGATGPMFGVSFANLEKLRKRIKVDHDLAVKLWNSRNIDARALATMVADPNQANDKLLQAWAKELDYHIITDSFAKHLVSRTPLARKKMELWTKSKDESIGRAGWTLLALLAMDDEDLADAYLANYLDTIEQTIHKAKNRTKEAMNNALIAIGSRNTPLEKKAILAATRIGKIEIDHGPTSCKTPDAVAYIRKTRARKKAKK